MSNDTEPKSRLKALFGKDFLLARAPHRGSRIQTFEGPRGYSVRAAVYLRHVAYFLTIVLCSSVTHYAMEAAGPYSIDGGMVMFFMASLTLAVGALASAGYTNHRNEILEDVRRYVFGMMVLPGTGISLILWIVTGLIAQEANPDAFSRTVDLGLLMVFGAVLVMPPIVFIRMMAGIRTLHRSTRDDEETMRAISRIDGAQW